MPIISLSIPEQMIKSMDEIQKSIGFSGRSDLVRAAIRLMLEDIRAKDSMTGRMGAVIVVTHGKNNEATITKLKHDFEDIVRTHVHSKGTHDDCIEFFLLEGEGPRIASMTKELQKDKGIKNVKLVIV